MHIPTIPSLPHAVQRYSQPRSYQGETKGGRGPLEEYYSFTYHRVNVSNRDRGPERKWLSAYVLGVILSPFNRKVYGTTISSKVGHGIHLNSCIISSLSRSETDHPVFLSNARC